MIDCYDYLIDCCWFIYLFYVYIYLECNYYNWEDNSLIILAVYYCYRICTNLLSTLYYLLFTFTFTVYVYVYCCLFLSLSLILSLSFDGYMCYYYFIEWLCLINYYIICYFYYNISFNTLISINTLLTYYSLYSLYYLSLLFYSVILFIA